MSGTVAVTGATGLIGQHLIAALVERGAHVRAIIRSDSPNAAPPGASVVRAPLEAAPLEAAFAGADAVVHLAGVVQAARAEVYTRVNVDGTRAVAAAARAAGARLIHISSLSAAGPAPADAPRSEDDPLHPITPYGRSKLAGEEIVAGTTGLEWMILRPGAVYGPGDRAMLPLFRIVRRGILPVMGRIDAAYTFIHVRDVVRAIEAAIRSSLKSETFFVGHPQPVTSRELIDQIGTALGRRVSLVRIPGPVAYVTANVCEGIGQMVGRALPLNRSRYREMCAEGFVCRVDRMRDRLGVVAATGLSDGLAETTEWYRGQGWLPR